MKTNLLIFWEGWGFSNLIIIFGPLFKINEKRKIILTNETETYVKVCQSVCEKMAQPVRKTNS